MVNLWFKSARLWCYNLIVQINKDTLQKPLLPISVSNRISYSSKCDAWPPTRRPWPVPAPGCLPSGSNMCTEHLGNGCRCTSRSSTNSRYKEKHSRSGVSRANITPKMPQMMFTCAQVSALPCPEHATCCMLHALLCSLHASIQHGKWEQFCFYAKILAKTWILFIYFYRRKPIF